MKTKLFLFLLIIISSMCWSLRSSANHVHVYLNTTWDDEYLYFCAPMDTIIVHAPSTAINNIDWNAPIGPHIAETDSVIITSANLGTWFFYSDEIYKYFYVYVNSDLPTQPPSMAHDNSFCTSFSLTLDAQNHLPGGYAATYLWSTGETTRIITVTTPGTYWVTITKACGSATYSMTITYANPMNPDLGPDQTMCIGDSVTLYPNDPNAATYEWSTGATTPTITEYTSGEYWVYVEDINGCGGYDTMNVTVIPLVNFQGCAVTYDTTTNKNRYDWYVDPAETEIDSIRCYVKNQFGVFIPLGTVPYADGMYIDYGSNPQSDFNEYYLTGITDCGEGNPSMINRSIWLTELTNELQWQNYMGNVDPLYYIVFARLTDNSIVPFDTVAACSGSGCLNHCLILPNPNISKYLVAFDYTCSISKSNAWVFSNYLDNTLTSAREVASTTLTIYPNPATNQITISGIETGGTLRLYDLSGKLLLERVNRDNTLELVGIAAGSYVLEVRAGAESGSEVVRGRVVVE